MEHSFIKLNQVESYVTVSIAGAVWDGSNAEHMFSKSHTDFLYTKFTDICRMQIADIPAIQCEHQTMLTIASIIHMDFELQLMIKLHNEAHADYDEITKWVFKFNLTAQEHNELLITKHTDLSILHNEGEWCYYLGATKDAATKILGEVTRPMSVHVPVVKICERLKKMDSQICELKYGTRDATVFPNTFYVSSSFETMGHAMSKPALEGRDSPLTGRLMSW
ncbi:hypothetical protein ACRRTK_005517 [Alexandromys fortis]